MFPDADAPRPRHTSSAAEEHNKRDAECEQGIRYIPPKINRWIRAGSATAAIKASAASSTALT